MATSIVGEQSHRVASGMRLRCWGDFSLVDKAGAALHLSRRKTRAMLAYLALHPDRPVSRERLAGLLWGDRGEEQARASLRQAIFELKAVSPAGDSFLVATRDHVALAPGRLSTDLSEMECLAANGDHQGLLPLLPERHDRLFANLDGIDEDFDDWLAIERTRQRDRLLALIADASAAAVAAGQTRAARALHSRLRELDPEGPVLADATSTPEAQVANNVPGQMRKARPRLAALAALFLVVAVIAASIWRFTGGSAPGSATVAVLPFKNLSSDAQPYFADGVSEEILNQLARDERLKVMGRTSAWSFRDQSLDAPTLGRKLNVDYLVEGSIRTVGANVRINVSLVRARDGALVWSERHDGALNDIIAMQDRIGGALSSQLAGGKGRLAGRAEPGTRGDVYSLYLTARGLIRDREEAKLDVAIELLRRAIKLDPRYAPAWASLGVATKHRMQLYRPDTETADRREALGDAQRALTLDPELPEAHYALALILDHTPQALALFERAAKLDPNNAEVWIELEQIYVERGDFPRRLQAARRAVAVDPLWWRAFSAASGAAWGMGHREEAMGYLRRAERNASARPYPPSLIRSDMAWLRQDFSEALKEAKAAQRVAGAGAQAFAEEALFGALFVLGNLDEARKYQNFQKIDRAMWDMWHGRPPPAEAVRALYVMPRGDWKDTYRLGFTLRTLLNAGRSAEIATLYDRRYRSPDDMKARQNHLPFLQLSSLFSLALRDVGRTAEADRLLVLAGAAAREALNRGPVPAGYHFRCAMVWAAGGDHARALSALERSVALGWIYGADGASLPDLSDEPAFRSLRGHPRFERVRARMRAHLERERREAAQFIA